jgi:amidase
MSDVITNRSASMNLEELLQTLDATAIVEGIIAKKFTSFEVVKTYIERIKKLNSKYNAIVTLNEEQALKRAQDADKVLLEGKIWGPLHGLPITIKDSFSTKGIKTTVGYKKYENFIPKNDAAAVRILKDAGAIILGKTNCATLCCDTQTISEVWGVTSNPFNTNYTSGGSSGGEATALALGLSPFGIGSDTVGSIRIPSSYCGIYGLKTSNQAVRKYGLMPPLQPYDDLDKHLTVIGPMARSVRDLKLGYNILNQNNTGQSNVSKSLNVAFTTEFKDIAIDDAVKKRILTAVNELSRTVNVEKTDSAIDLKKATKMGNLLCLYEFYPKEAYTREVKSILRMIFTLGLFKGGTFNIYKKVLGFRKMVEFQLDQFLSKYDCWIVPVTATSAFPHNPKHKRIALIENGKRKKIKYLTATHSFTVPFSFSGHPTVVIPIGRNQDGLPIAIQLIGKSGQDDKLLAAAEIIDEAINTNIN